MSTGQIITPAGTVINLSNNLSGTQSPARAKAIALNPVNHNYAAVLLMGASSAVDVINLGTGKVTQQYIPFKDKSGSFTGISYSPDGAHLLFSQDNSFLAVANVDPTTDALSDNTHVALAASNAAINCNGVTEGLPSDPVTGLCGKFYTGGTANPSGVAVSADNKTAYVLLNQNNTLQGRRSDDGRDQRAAKTKGCAGPRGQCAEQRPGPRTIRLRHQRGWACCHLGGFHQRLLRYADRREPGQRRRR